MTARSLKTKYTLTALGLGAVVALLLTGVLFWQYRLDATRLSRLAFDSVEDKLLGELNEREGLAVLVVEQNAALALEASARAYVLEVGKVAVVPGSGFGAPGFVRLSYACSMANIRDGVGRLASALASLK